MKRTSGKIGDRIYTAFVAAVCVGVPVLVLWGALVLLGKLVEGWW